MTPEATLAPYRLRQGTRPLLISMPHVGTQVPAEQLHRMTPAAAVVADTDWHLERLYDFAAALGASVLVATQSRYVIDLNRPPNNENLYPGQDTTGLCPVDTFDKEPLYLDGQLPAEPEIQARIAGVWKPYHLALKTELARLQAAHGTVALWDAHSIRSVLPRFFEGRLPDLNLGTADGHSCAPTLAHKVADIAAAAQGYSSILNGRFKGGYITREYGNPGKRIHGVQLELAQVAYMSESYPFDFDEAKANKLRPALRAMLEAMLEEAERG
jgi:N-formylglutamate deformylase